MSSAYLRLLMFLLAILIPACASSSPEFLLMYSAYKWNKQGHNIKPWHTPFPFWNQPVVPCPVLTAASRNMHANFSRGRSGPLVLGGWNAKVECQEIPGVTGKFGLRVQNKAGQRLTEFCQQNALVIANTFFQQHKIILYTWTSPDGQHWNQIDYILCSQIWRSSVQSAQTRLGADCGSNHELPIAKFRLKLKEVGKSTRPSRYDLNQIPCNYTVEVTNRFKGLYLIECLRNYEGRFMTLYRRQWSKPSPRKNKCKKATWLSKEALQIAEKRKEVKAKGEKERYTHLNAEFQRIARGDKKVFLRDQCQEM